MIGDQGILLMGAMQQKGFLSVNNGRGLEGSLFLLDYDRGVFELDIGGRSGGRRCGGHDAG